MKGGQAGNPKTIPHWDDDECNNYRDTRMIKMYNSLPLSLVSLNTKYCNLYGPLLICQTWSSLCTWGEAIRVVRLHWSFLGFTFTTFIVGETSKRESTQPMSSNDCLTLQFVWYLGLLLLLLSVALRIRASYWRNGNVDDLWHHISRVFSILMSDDEAV